MGVRKCDNKPHCSFSSACEQHQPSFTTEPDGVTALLRPTRAVSDMTSTRFSLPVSNSAYGIVLNTAKYMLSLLFKSRLLQQSLFKDVLTHCSEQLHTPNKNNNSAPCPALLFICDYTAFTFGVCVLHLNHFGQCCHNNQLKWDCLSWEKQPHKAKSKRGQVELR